ncbi:glycosyltransferase 61 family protein [Oceaniovalibus sp. ACAM 378]|uniref:glycosyltransferase 61 family protein n=1 Tax=Oceaniovalibus sp. ACAM 378 TaxID=2599923 RepID=UPI0011D41C2F|nr:glycosyltransferase 61 family protein [Oceaniovalibus sp. ACAM 378]TYB84093.1 glycosyltransferase family 61 protein [Oceaniovalibus sp. ACAM 378]
MAKSTSDQIVELRDVAVAPYVYKRPKFRGGIEAPLAPPQGRMRRGANLRDDPQPIDRGGRRLFGGGDLDRLKGRYLYGGPMWNHFGHFFVDCIHRLWALKAGGTSYDGIVFLAVQGLLGVRSDADLAAAQPPGFLIDLMRLLDMPDVPVIMVRAPMLFDRLDVPEAGTAPRQPIAPFYRPYLDGYQAALEDKLALHISRAPERLYLGRSHLLAKGGVLGSSHLEQALKAAGAYVSTPEAVGLPVQFGHLLGAKTVVFDEGSAGHPTQVMSRTPTEYLMFPRRAANEIYGDAISQRAPFALLAENDNIAVLPDRHGSTSSPGGLAAYRDPGAVWDGLVRRDLVQGAFDMDAWRAAEAADLIAARSATPEIESVRRAALESVRG